MKSFKELSALVKQWAADKDILRRDASPQQYLKILEETGETAAAILRNQPDKIKDGIGDMAVTMIIYAAQKGVAMEGRGKDSTDGLNNIDTQKAFQNFIEYINGGFFLYAYDMLVILATKHGLTLEECLEAAWDEIKDRKGKTVDNVFVKDEANSVWIKDENGFCVAIKDEDLVVGKVYADIQLYNENTVFLRFVKEDDDAIYFEHAAGSNLCYGAIENGLIGFEKSMTSFFYEVPDSIMEELGLKHDTVRQG